MNLEMVREVMHGSRHLFKALLLLTVLAAVLYGYRTLVQGPELERMQSAYFTSRDAGGGEATRRTVHYQNSLRDLARFEEKLIAKKDFARFLEELFAMASKRNLTLNGISYKPKTEKGMVNYGMTLAVSGKYPALKAFIGDLSRYPQMVTVDAVSLRNTSAIEEAIDLQLQITVFLKTEGA